MNWPFFYCSLKFSIHSLFLLSQSLWNDSIQIFSSLLKQVRYYLFRRVHVKTFFHWDKLYGRTIWDSQRNRSRKDWWRKGKKIDQKEKDELKHNQPVCWLHFPFTTLLRFLTLQFSSLKNIMNSNVQLWTTENFKQ